MSRGKIVLYLVVAVVLAGFVWMGFTARLKMSVTLPDKSVLRVEKVSYGKREPFTLPGGWWRNLKSNVVTRLPKVWAARFPKPPTGGRSSWNYVITGHTNTDALQVWIARWDPATRSYSGYHGIWATLIDDDGCAISMTTAGGESDPSVLSARTAATPLWVGGGGPSTTMNWLTFEAFPRHQRQIRMRLYDQSRVLIAEMTIPNPGYTSRGASGKPVSPLPVSVQDGEVKYTLASLTYRTNFNVENTNIAGQRMSPQAILPVFEVMERGKPSKEWHAGDAELWDSAGNFASRMNTDPTRSVFETMYLCPREEAWRLVVKFYGLEASEVASNAVWKIPGVTIPGAGEIQMFGETRTMQGASVTISGIAGPGKVTYANGVPVSAAVSPNRVYGDMTSSASTGSIIQQIVTSASPTLAIRMTGMSANQRLSVRATDQLGRDFYARKWDYGIRSDGKGEREVHFIAQADRPDPNCVYLDVPADSKTLDLTISVHTGRTVEFNFKPPAKDGK